MSRRTPGRSTPRRRPAWVDCIISVAALLLTGVGTAHASAPPWGACGIDTAESKLVREFNPRTYYTLRCGGPMYSDNPRYGYRHILRYHKTDFERMALGTGQNWRDVADLAMDTISRDPDSAKPADGYEQHQHGVPGFPAVLR